MQNPEIHTGHRHSGDFVHRRAGALMGVPMAHTFRTPGINEIHQMELALIQAGVKGDEATKQVNERLRKRKEHTGAHQQASMVLSDLMHTRSELKTNRSARRVSPNIASILKSWEDKEQKLEVRWTKVLQEVDGTNRELVPADVKPHGFRR